MDWEGDAFGRLEERIGYRFRDREWLVRAMTHRSYANEAGSDGNNQRLEFLGDSVLNLLIAEVLFEKFPEVDEGALSSYLASLVNEAALCDVAGAIDLGAHVLLGRGEELSGGREKASVLADAHEALLGAIYVDGGLDAVRDVVARLHGEAIARCEPAAPPEDPKSRLQRLVQSEGPTRPVYDIIDERGPAHDRIFVAEVSVNGTVFGIGEGRSKKEAEQHAAGAALDRWEADEDD